MHLNERTYSVVETLLECGDDLRIDLYTLDCGTRIVDFGIEAEGGLLAGCALAEVCLADLGRVSVGPAGPTQGTGPRVQVVTDFPVIACLASQYAGWRVAEGKFFAMLSGPIRAAAAADPLFERLNLLGDERREPAEVAVGVMETRAFPDEAICLRLAKQAGVRANGLTLLVAPTASLAGTIQVVARSVETALHKMVEIGFDVTGVVSAHGSAPIPPIGRDDLAAIGRTNDAILYGAEVTLWLTGFDEQIERLGPSIPSQASSDFGRPFAEIFAAAGHDFYKIDPHLFSPAVVNFVSLESGKSYRFGETRPDILEQSFRS